MIGTFSHTIPIAPLLGGAKFDPKSLGWIGSITSDTSVCVAWHNSPVKSWADLATKPITFGGTGKGSDPDMMASLLKNVFNAPIKLVSGYPGTADIVVATERGELDGLCGLSYSTITSRYPDWLDQKKATVLVQANLQKDPALPDVPLVFDLARTEQQRQILTLIVGPQIMARPYAMPPGTPKERVEIIRAAFMKTSEGRGFPGRSQEDEARREADNCERDRSPARQGLQNAGRGRATDYPRHRIGNAAMHAFNLKVEQVFDPRKHVEKILGEVGGGDVTVACWEPGQFSPNHLHPNCTEIYFCFEGGGTMRTPAATVPVTPGSFVVHPRGELHEYENGAQRTLLFRVRYGDDFSTIVKNWQGQPGWKPSPADLAWFEHNRT